VSALLAILWLAIGVAWSPVHALLTIREHPEARCDLVRFETNGFAVPFCTYGNTISDSAIRLTIR
jgi:hypothetical protein